MPGYIPGWESLLPSDMPVMIFWENEANPLQDMTFFGFDINFRGHPKQTFKLLGNAIYNGMD